MIFSIAKIIMHLSIYFGYSLLIDTIPSGAEECTKALYGFCSHQNTENITVKEKFPCKKSEVVNNSSKKSLLTLKC